MNAGTKTTAVVIALSAVFIGLAGVFVLNLFGRMAPLPVIPLVDPQYTNTATARDSYAELVRKKEDLSDFDCYACHEKGKPPPIRYDTNHNIIIPKEHETIVMGHGRHDRNNNCYNCHNESNLELFQTRDGRELKFAESTPLCGSCHGPTYRDWQAGIHGRTSGHWLREAGEFKRLDCVDCHNPHSPKFGTRKPAPGPHPLRLQRPPSSEMKH